MPALQRMIAAAVIGTLFAVYLQTIGDLPMEIVAPTYSMGQLTP